MAAAFPDVLFMNFGLAEHDAAACDWLEPADRPYKYHLSLVRRVLKDVDVSGRTVLEIGTGRGGNCHYLSRYTTVRRVYGLDSSAVSVRSAARLRIPNAEFLCADAGALPFRARMFGVVFNVGWSPSYPALSKLLLEVDRVLEPGGEFLSMGVWPARNTAVLRRGPFTLIDRADVSEEVLEALNRDDGVAALLRKGATKSNRALLDVILNDLDAARVRLAFGTYRARILRFRKPKARRRRG